MVDEVRSWGIAAQKREIPLTLISSDNVFTGPWMFHDEDSTSLSSNKQAVLTRIVESELMAWHPDALVVRTNVFGWTPNGLSPSWIDSLIQGNIQGASRQLDTLRNATPIATGELMKLLECSWSKGLTGIYHIAGAERCHPVRLAQKICEVFGLGWRNAVGVNDSQGTKNSLRFGFGETSLQTKKIRQALQVPLPMLDDSVEQLYAEYQNGFAERIRPNPTSVTAKAA
jgi:dTDP-4-dehydrorhamnose reductase